MSAEGKQSNFSKISNLSTPFILIMVLIIPIILSICAFNPLILHKASAFQTTTFTETTGNGSGWKESDLGFTFAAQNKLIIGDGRNDGVNRIYSGDDEWVGNGFIYEFSFVNGQWEKEKVRGDSPYTYGICGFEIGKLHNDEMNRIYVSNYILTEYNFTSKSWTGMKVADIDGTRDIVLGDAQNDGHIRMYLAGGSEINEISYNYGDWDSIRIDTVGSRAEKLLITDGRHDNILRLYAAIDNCVYEYTWSGNKWIAEECCRIGDEPYMPSGCDMSGGDGRNDGKDRIYLAADDLYELTYNGESWDKVVIASSNNINTVIIGADNDGINHLYTGGQKGIGEYTFSDGTWKKTSNYETSYKINDLAVGQGRNDEINRIYATGDDKHIYEYSFTGNTKVPSGEEVTSEEVTPKETETPTETKKDQKSSFFDIDFWKAVIAGLTIAVILGIPSSVKRLLKGNKESGEDFEKLSKTEEFNKQK